MPSKNTVKFIKSLQLKKFRKQENAFFVEGNKNVTELLESDFMVTHLLYTSKFETLHTDLVASFGGEKYAVLPQLLASMGSFVSNDSALAVARMKDNKPISVEPGELVLALDDINDPGNLGTILRIGDWYGIKKMIFSPHTADFYNPKVLHASMGSFTRMTFVYTDLALFIRDANVPVYGAFLHGENIHKAVLKSEGIILMGNESSGISKELERLVSHKLTIPSFGAAESLNVGVATAVICDNFRRNRLVC